MQIRNTTHAYGWVSITLHWVMALLLIGMYFVGDYMVELTYYDPLYHTLPFWHKSIGIALGFALLFRLVWNFSNPKPATIQGAPEFTHRLAKLGHLALYGLLVVLLISGYLISTAKGKGIEVFGLFELPALLASNEQRGEIAGEVHEIAATLFMLLVAVHALAAIFHHVYWKDNTLTRMLGRSSQA
ncbi:cytochrome b [uncultured Thiothrix sp.]|uniref:cytochrome b n=1 Tax=uncultured Thiothrix sp. TaxID=223185 RepID=UPI0026112C8C|nr:cytochrome b [uncultured Thiothrix sp.]